MGPLRAYLLVRCGPDDWSVSTHRDLEGLQAAWQPFAGHTDVAAVLHVGFDRPDTLQFDEVTRRFPGRVLLTGSARYAFPCPSKVAPLTAGTVENLPLFVALCGWGYTCTAEEVGLQEDADDAWEHGPAPALAPRGWVADLRGIDPTLAAVAASAGIGDEATYLAREHTLTIEQRISLAEFRLRTLAGIQDLTSEPLVIVQHGPPWLLDRPTSTLDLTVRIANIFSNKKITVVRDLLRFSLTDLARLPNFGRKSFAHLGESLLAAVREGPFTAAARAAQAEASELLSHIRRDMTALPERAAHILRRRMGLDAPLGTLQEIGDDFHVTRERIRQVEFKYIREISRNCVWLDLLVDKLDRLLSGRIEPLPIEGLEILDRWFTGVDQWPEAFSYLLEVFCDRRFWLLHIGGQRFVSALSQGGWDAAVSNASRLLESEVSGAWTEEQARTMVEGLLTGPGHELSTELWRTVAARAHFADTTDGGRVLIAFGHGTEQIVQTVLAEADSPIHYTEIARRASTRLGRSVDSRRAHNAAAEVGLLFARGTYGLMRHVPLTAEEIDLVRAEAEDIIERGPPNRQWHCEELYESLRGRGLDFDGRLTQYVLNIILTGSATCAYLGRFMWARRRDYNLSTAHRIDLRQAVISLLRNAGHPMSTAEIREQLVYERGVGGHFQIHPSDPIVRVSDGLWGLSDMDFEPNPS